MTTERDARTRTVLSWLRDDAHENAERVLLRALDEVDATQQRRSWWPARRSEEMNRLTLAAAAAVAVIALAVVAYNLLPASSVGPKTSAAPIPTQAVEPSGTQLPRVPTGPIAPGTYSLRPFPLTPQAAFEVTLTVPAGWNGSNNGLVADAGTEPPGAALGFGLPNELFVDPCEGSALGSPVISAGTTVDDLVSAFAQVDSDYAVSTAVDITVDGYPGKRVELLLPSDDFSECDGGQYWVWDVGPYAQGPGNRWHLWILDVAGTRVVILGEDFPNTPDAVHRQLVEMVNTLQIGP